MLSETRYYHWPGIFESLEFFRSIEHISIPLEDPREWIWRGRHIPPLRVSLEPHMEPMIYINRVVKAIWQFAKSIRIFVRAAVAFRTTGHPEAYPNEFWVRSPLFTRDVFSMLQRVLEEGFGIQCYEYDTRDQFPYQFTGVGFYANLLSDSVHCKGYDSECSLLREVIEFVLGNRDLVQELLMMEELVAPPLVSYAYNIAPKSYDLIHEGHSPSVTPCNGNDLGDMGVVMI